MRYTTNYDIIFIGEIMNKIKLIGIDLDGTALNRNKELSEKNKEAFGLCRKKGIHIVPVTGRPYSGIYEEYKLGMRCDYTISTNGAAVTDVKSGRRIISHTMDKKTSLRVMELLKDFDCYFGAFYEGFGYLTRDDLKHELLKFKNTPLYEYIQRTRIPIDDHYKTLEKFGGCDNIYVIAKNNGIRKEICETIKDVEDIFYTCSDYNDVEIGGNCSKGSTLLELAERLSVAPDEVMAIGDSGNDLNMLKSAGFSVAMENACDNIKEASDFVTKSCEESGVAYAIEKFVL